MTRIYLNYRPLFELPKIEDLCLTTFQFDSRCRHIDLGKYQKNYPTSYLPNLLAYCEKIVLYVEFYTFHYNTQELTTCKRISYEYYCEEFFIVKSKSKYSCANAIYFNLDVNIIKENCNFDFYFNKTDIKPLILDGGHEIILANWPSYKRILCSVKNSIAADILCHPYVLLNWSILCNCDTEAESNFLLESLAACVTSTTDLAMYYNSIWLLLIILQIC